MIKLMSWADVKEALARVEDALGVDDANLLRAALVLHRSSVTMTEYRQTSWALGGDARPVVASNQDEDD